MSEGDDLMTDEEFELLDQLHGSGNGPSIEELDAATKPAGKTPARTVAGRRNSCCCKTPAAG
ncbi:hypothetical protein O9992_14305 [Vibrio lentus]|nr:hypothetical protein [Vibrio lentus]